MPQVTLKSEGNAGVDKPFELEHAQAILDLNKRNSTKTWVLNDPKFKLDKDGKIISKSNSGAPEETQK